MTAIIAHFRVIAAVAVALLGNACGWVEFGGGSGLNDPEPTGGTIVAAAPLTPIADTHVSGTVTIYDMSGGAFIIRINGLSAPAETGLALVPVINGTSVTPLPLRATSGTQNYTLQVSLIFPRWEKLRLHSTLINRDYAEAIFPVF